MELEHILEYALVCFFSGVVAVAVFLLGWNKGFVKGCTTHDARCTDTLDG